MIQYRHLPVLPEAPHPTCRLHHHQHHNAICYHLCHAVSLAKANDIPSLKKLVQELDKCSSTMQNSVLDMGVCWTSVDAALMRWCDHLCEKDAGLGVALQLSPNESAGARRLLEGASAHFANFIGVMDDDTTHEVYGK